MIKRIAVLITCHNRVEKTLECLGVLFDCTIDDDICMDVYLVDDGSADGTGFQVRLKYPQVNVIQGNGSLYWAGGMRLAWQEAAKHEFDYYLWLNDDTFVFNNAIQSLLECAKLTSDKAIICGAVSSKLTGKVTYGGKNKSDLNFFEPNGKMQSCEIVNGNFLLVPRCVFNAIGNIDAIFTHAIGDWDYGLRAIKAGFKCYVAPEIVGTCEANKNLPAWWRKEVPFHKRLKSLYSPLGRAQPKPYFIFAYRHFGLFTAVKHLISMHIRVLFPQFWYIIKLSLHLIRYRISDLIHRL